MYLKLSRKSEGGEMFVIWFMLGAVILGISFACGRLWEKALKDPNESVARAKRLVSLMMMVMATILLFSLGMGISTTTEIDAVNSGRGIVLCEKDLKPGVIYHRWYPGGDEYVGLDEEPSVESKVYRLPRAVIPDQCDRFVCVKDQDGTLNYLPCPKKEKKAEAEKIVIPIK